MQTRHDRMMACTRYHLYLTQSMGVIYITPTIISKRGMRDFIKYGNHDYVVMHRGCTLYITDETNMRHENLVDLAKDILDEYKAVGAFSRYRLGIRDNNGHYTWDSPKISAVFFIS